jgi:N-acetylmuramoyl-L-alanine amidase
VRLYRLGDAGEAVSDIRARLGALGFPTDRDPEGCYGEATVDAVRGFQQSRRLNPDGVVGPDTWRALYEAGYVLGDRPLDYRRPMARGEDVAELQRRLNDLGFDAGKVDGVFGPDTQRALRDFQHNRQIAEDGITGPQVLGELRLVSRTAEKTGREAIREREWLRSLPRTLAGSRVYFDAGCRNDDERDRAWDAANGAALALQGRGGVPLMSRSADTNMPERVRARRANRLGAEMIVSFQLPVEEPGVFFFASSMSRSEAGALLAAEMAAHLDLMVDGRAVPILKETRAPAVVIATTALGASVGERAVTAMASFLVRAAPTAGAADGHPSSLR